MLVAPAYRVGVELTDKMHACTECSMAKAYRKGIAHETKCRSDKKLGRVFVDLGGRKDVASVGSKEYPMIVRDDRIRRTWMYFLASVGGKEYPMIVRDDCIRRTWMYFLNHKSDVRALSVVFLLVLVLTENRHWSRLLGLTMAVSFSVENLNPFEMNF